MIRFECPGCGAVYSAGPHRAGRAAKCPKCAAGFVIPPPPTEPPPPGPDAPVEVGPCPACGLRVAAAPGDLGAEVECPNCRAPFTALRARPAPEPPELREERPPRPRREPPRYGRPRTKPGQLVAVGGMLLGGGIYALVFDAGLLLGSSGVCCLWPAVYLALVWGVLAIVRGSGLIGAGDDPAPPRTLLVLQVLTVLNFDVVNCVLGIVGLVLLNDPAVRRYYERRSVG